MGSSIRQKWQRKASKQGKRERKEKQNRRRARSPNQNAVKSISKHPGQNQNKKMMILKEFEDKGWERCQKSETRSWDTDSYVLENQKFLKQFNFPRTPLLKNAPPPILKWLPFTSRLVFDFRTKSILEGRKRSMNFNKFN